MKSLVLLAWLYLPGVPVPLEYAVDSGLTAEDCLGLLEVAREAPELIPGADEFLPLPDGAGLRFACAIDPDQ